MNLLVLTRKAEEPVLLSEVDDSFTGGSVGVHQMLGDLSFHVFGEGDVVLVLVEELFWVHSDLGSGLKPRVSTDETEIQSLCLLVFGIQFVLFKNLVNRLLTHMSERGPLTAHEAYKAALAGLNDVGPRELGGCRSFTLAAELISLVGEPSDSVCEKRLSVIFDAHLRSQFGFIFYFFLGFDGILLNERSDTSPCRHEVVLVVVILTEIRLQLPKHKLDLLLSRLTEMGDVTFFIGGADHWVAQIVDYE